MATNSAFSFSVAEVAAAVRVKPRNIQYWVEQNIVRPDFAHAGRGVHRSFTLTEARIAAVAAALNSVSMSALLLRKICDAVRPVIAAETPSEMYGGFGSAREAVLAGRPVLMAVIPHIGEGGQELARVDFWEPPRHDIAALFDTYTFVAVINLQAIIENVQPP